MGLTKEKKRGEEELGKGKGWGCHERGREK